MDNKNEKTFSDLFLDAASDEKIEENKDKEITFDSFVAEVDTSKESGSLSFGDISSAVINDISSNEEGNISFNNIFENDLEAEEQESSLDSETEDVVEEVNPFMEEVNEEVSEIENPFIREVSEEQGSSLDNETEDVVEEVNPFMEDVNEEVSEIENPFTGEVVEEPDNILEEKEEVISEEVNPFMEEVNEEESEIENPFVGEVSEEQGSSLDNETEDVVEEVNPFMEEVNEEVSEIENPFIREVNEEQGSSLENSSDNVSSSPFFENDSFDEIDKNPMFSNSISLGEVSNTSSSVGKLNLSNTKHFNVKVVPKKEPLSKFIIGVISYSFFIWLLLIGVALLVYVLDIKLRAAKGDYSAPTFNAYVVLTGSMLPEIHVNDVVITKKTPAKELEVGDVITFASADSRFMGTIITHRIIKKNQDKEGNITFQTQGDNNNVADNALVPEANIFGRVILRIPKLGYLQEFLATDGGWIIVILIPCMAVISYDIVKIAKGVKNKKNKNVKLQSR